MDSFATKPEEDPALTERKRKRKDKIEKMELDIVELKKTVSSMENSISELLFLFKNKMKVE